MSSQRIKKNMMDSYSESLGRPLLEAELRVLRCIEQLSVPDWYSKYSKPSRLLRDYTPIESRPPRWRTYRANKVTGSPKRTPKKSPRKTPRKQSPKSSPRKQLSSPEAVRTSPADSGFNETYRISRRQTDRAASPAISISSEDCDSTLPVEERTVVAAAESSAKSKSPRLNASKINRSFLNNSNTFPRVTPSRKIENINIVFSKPFPKPKASPGRTLYTITKNLEMSDVSGKDEESSLSSHASFLIADIEPNGSVKTRVQLSAGPDSDEDASTGGDSRSRTPELGPGPCCPRATSPNTRRFLSSSRKSTALERIVQSSRSGRGNLVQDIIDELDRSCHMRRLLGKNRHWDEEEEEYDRLSTDSELAKSTSISVKSYDSSTPQSDDEKREQPEEEEEDESADDDIYWISAKLRQLPRTSSRLSMMSSSRASSSPGLSPIRREHCGLFVRSYSKSPRQLFRIDETNVPDSGYSDTGTCSRSPPASGVEDRRFDGYWSSSGASSPTQRVADVPITTDAMFAESGPFVLKSFLV